MIGTKLIPCPSCGQEEINHIPIWVAPTTFKSNERPDYMGCRKCNTMLPYDEWWPPNTDTDKQLDTET